MRAEWILGLVGSVALAGCAMAPPEGTDEDFAAIEASLTASHAGWSRGGRRTLPYAPEGVPLLQSFEYAFHNGDHEMREIQVMPDRAADTLAINFQDKNGDDAYDYRIRHWDYLGPAYEGQSVGACRGRCSVRLWRPSYAAGWRFVVVGFRFTYADGDHEIQELTLRESAGVLTVALADGNGDDNFSYAVRYAYIPSTEIAHLGERYKFGAGSGMMTIGAGSPPVIRGFSFAFWDGDNELESLRLDLPGDGTADIEFSDEDPHNEGGSWYRSEPSDHYDAYLDYAILGRSWVIASPLPLYPRSSL